jgi:predicted flap endonuclease-1-like 5' DNA nuclease
MLDFTANQWAIVALVLVLGWLLGLLSRSGGAKWRRAYEQESIAREATEQRLATAQTRIVELERDVSARPIGSATAASVGAAAAGRRDDLALIRGVGRGGETQLNDVGIHRYTQIADLTDPEAATLENRLGLKPGTISYEEWREQAVMLRDGNIDAHRTRYAAA